MNQRKDTFSGDSLGFILETIVYLELRRRAKHAKQDVYYYSNQRSECDFVLCDGNQTLAAYQVSYDISNPKTYNREIKGCVTGATGTHCENLYLLTYNDSREPVVKDGYTIKIMPVCALPNEQEMKLELKKVNGPIFPDEWDQVIELVS